MPYTPTPRKPTGIASLPFIMLTGQAKAGKSLTAYLTGRSSLVDHCYVIDLGEGTADEYGRLDCYEVLPWGRSFADLTDTVKWACDQVPAPGLVNVVILDSGTEVWESFKDRAATRARGSKAAVAKLREDPDAEIETSMNYWNDAKSDWARIMQPMRLSPNCIGIVAVRSEVVSVVSNGTPTKEKVTSYQCEKTLPAACTAHIDVAPDHTVRLMSVRSLDIQVPPAGLLLEGDNPIGVFVDMIRPPDGRFQVRDLSVPQDEQRYVNLTQKQMLIDLVLSIDDQEMRRRVKLAFAEQWGVTSEVPVYRFDEAVKWLLDRIEAEGATTTPPPDPPPTETVAEVAARAEAMASHHHAAPPDAPGDATPPPDEPPGETAPADTGEDPDAPTMFDQHAEGSFYSADELGGYG